MTQFKTALVCLAVALVLAATFWLSRQLSVGWRWAFRLIIVGMMVLLLVPQQVFVELVRSSEGFLPFVGTVLGHPAADHVVHFLVFFVAGIPFARLMRVHGWALALGWLVILAIGLEALQILVGGHQAHVLDGVANLGGALVGFAVGAWIVRRE